MLFEIGDIVEPTKESNFILRSGCCYYDNAVVVRSDPLVLVSQCGEMRWAYTIENKKFQKVGNASINILKICLNRLHE